MALLMNSFRTFLKINFLFLISCNSPEKINIQGEKKEESLKISSPLLSVAAGNQALIIASINVINQKKDSSDQNSICFRFPCRAGIRIERLLDKGPLFKTPENLSGITYVEFPFTLLPTNKDLFPELKKQYPGLKINDKFEAVIQSRMALPEGVKYYIYDYKKIE